MPAVWRHAPHLLHNGLPMATYDPLAILDRASASSAQWLQQLDDAAARQAEARQRAFTLGLASDLAVNTHQTTLDKVNAGNVYGARRAEADTRLLPAYETRQGALWRLDTDQAQMQQRLLPAQEAMQGSAYRLGHAQNRLALDTMGRAWTPDNQRARDAAEDMRYQNPIAEAAARDAAGRRADPLQSAQAAQRAADAWPGAQGIAGQYAAPYASGLYAAVSSALLAGNLNSANALLQRAQLGQVAPAAHGQMTYTDARGHAMPAMSPAAVAALLQTLTAQAPTAWQQYTEAATRGSHALSPAQESQKGILEHRIQTLDKALVNALDDTERASLHQQRVEATQSLEGLLGARPATPAADFGLLGFGAPARTGQTVPTPSATPPMAVPAVPARAPVAPASPPPPPAAASSDTRAGREIEIDPATGTLRRPPRVQPRTDDALETYRDAAQAWREADRKLQEILRSQKRYEETGRGLDRPIAIERRRQAEAQARNALLAAREVYQRAQQADATERQRRAPTPTAPQTPTTYGITLPSYGVEQSPGPYRP
jgi:hypothetical protein